tara:strand:- start:34 stop:1923 length:1890 start_codon:yes stop_codon:yes gene_type:complete
MATLTGKKIANTYKDLLMVNTGSTYSGLTSSLQQLQDGDGTQAPIQMSSDTLNVTGTFKIGGVALTASVSALNASSDLTGTTGVVVGNGSGGISGRTITAGGGVSITNGNGVSGNPTIALHTTGITSASYGPFIKGEFNSFGQLVSAGISTATSIATLGVATLNVANIHGSGTVSVTGSSHFVGAITVDGLTSLKDVALVSLRATKINATNISVASLFAQSLTVEGYDTSLTDFTTNTMQVVTRASIAAANFVGAVSGTSGVFSAIVSVGTLAATTAITVGGNAVATAVNLSTVSAAMTSRVDAVSVLSKTNLTAITSVNTVVAAVSALTATNLAASTSINSKITAVSAALTTSIGSSNTHIAAVSVLSKTNLTAITSVNSVVAAVSVLSKTNLNAITSVNTVVAAVSVLTATNLAATTSINSKITTVSAALTTSIGSSNTHIAAVSVLSKTNLTAITSVNGKITAVSVALATSIGARLPLAGGTITGHVSSTSHTFSGIVSAAAVVATSVGTTAIHVTKNTIVNILTLTDAASVSLSFNQGSNFTLTLGGNRTLSTPTNAAAGSGGSIFVVQDGTGGRTLAYATEWHFAGGTAPTLSTAAAAVDRIDYIVRTSTDIHAVASLDVKAGA